MLNDETDDMGMVEYAWSHAIISDKVYNTIKKECSFFGLRKNDTKACLPAIRAFAQAYSDIDIYSIYTPVCLSSLITSPHRPKKLKLGPRFLSLHVSSLISIFVFFNHNIHICIYICLN